MPAADITEVAITFGNGIKREEYGPVKKAEVTIRAIVNQGEDGVIALNYISRIAEAKCKELLLGTAAPTSEPSLPPTSSASPASTAAAQGSPETPAENAEHPGEPQRRTRRTKAEMEAARAAETAAADAPVVSEPSPTAPENVDTPAEPDTSDEWDVGATDAPQITDIELNHSCSETAARTKKPLEIKALIGSFSPATDEFNVDKGGRKFTVNDIPQTQRADFIAKLKALT